jgi:hypothetical protein
MHFAYSNDESQRDSGLHPGVARVASPARTELPWVDVVEDFNPNGDLCKSD